MAYNGPAHGSHIPHDSALSVGSHDEAVKIRELESEVSFLAEKATSASQRFADYENEIRVLQAELRQEQRKNAKAINSSDGAPAAPQPERPGISRFGSLMQSRKVSPAPLNSTLQSPSARENELESALVKERTARIAAEKKAKEVNSEIEELSATLFQQANEMVASERRENATLKDKLQAMELVRHNTGGLETVQRENTKLKERLKILEQRDLDRKRRLERLEAANKRIERVGTLLIPR